MKNVKKCKNVEFTVKYDDGTKKEVKEGILFEFEGNGINLHIGTSRIECLFSIAEALVETIKEWDLEEEFKDYIERKFDD